MEKVAFNPYKANNFKKRNNKHSKSFYQIPLVALSTLSSAGLGIKSKENEFLSKMPKIKTFDEFCNNIQLRSGFSKSIAESGIEHAYDEYKAIIETTVKNYKAKNAINYKQIGLKYGLIGAGAGVALCMTIKVTKNILDKLKNLNTIRKGKTRYE